MKQIILALALMLGISSSSLALNLTSTDINEGMLLNPTFIYNGFGCQGDNLSPQLSWQDIPVGTRSFAITMFDPNVPTGSGWYHWVVIDIPVSVTDLEQGSGAASKMPVGSRLIKNDYSVKEFGGACPPIGHGLHRYQFTIWAMPFERFDLPDDASAALVSFILNNQSLAHSRITAVYAR